MTEQTWLEGAISIEAVLQGDYREIEVVYVQHGKWKREKARLLQRLKKARIPVEQVTAEFIEEKAGGKSHGGMIALAGPRHFNSLADLVEGKAAPFVVMLDGFEDPFNFGQAVRTLYAAGAEGVVVRPRNWLTATNVRRSWYRWRWPKRPLPLLSFSVNKGWWWPARPSTTANHSMRLT